VYVITNAKFQCEWSSSDVSLFLTGRR